MFDLNKLMDLSESYATYVILGSAAVIVGLLVNNLGGFFLQDLFSSSSGLLRYPGQALVMGGFFAFGLAAESEPSSVRIASIAMGTWLFIRFFFKFSVFGLM